VNAAVYTRYELIRAFRNIRFFIFSFGFPLIIYFLIAVPNRHVDDIGGTGISAPLYFMVGLAAFGAMTAVLASGGRIAAERSVGWNRQLRITPLSPRAYFRTKVVTGYVLAILSILLLYLAGISLGVDLSAADWVQMTALILVALIPFTALGILMGHVVPVDSIGPAIGGITALFSLLGGSWFPVASSGAFHDVAQLLPSYWLVQAGRVSLGGSSWGALGWGVIAVWTVVLGRLAAWAYRRDTKRV
jgi:ABC-2 type transport system permease protein